MFHRHLLLWFLFFSSNIMKKILIILRIWISRGEKRKWKQKTGPAREPPQIGHICASQPPEAAPFPFVPMKICMAEISQNSLFLLQRRSHFLHQKMEDKLTSARPDGVVLLFCLSLISPKQRLWGNCINQPEHIYTCSFKRNYPTNFKRSQVSLLL